MDNQQDDSGVHETTETVAEAVETTEETVTLTAAELADLKKKAEVSSQNFERLKKIEEENKRLKEIKVDVPPAPTHSLADLRAISSVHEDDVERLERFAKAEGVQLKDAVKHPEWKAIEALRAEQRDTASSTNVSNTRRATAKPSDATLIERASRGELPDSDEEIERLIAAKSKKK